MWTNDNKTAFFPLNEGNSQLNKINIKKSYQFVENIEKFWTRFR